MMSKERELLEHCRMYLSSLGMFVEHSTLINKIDELLAKRPSLNLDISEFQRGYGAALTSAVYMKEPKREPLSDGITADMYHANNKATHPDSYWAGVYDAEKAHGIGGAE